MKNTKSKILQYLSVYLLATLTILAACSEQSVIDHENELPNESTDKVNRVISQRIVNEIAKAEARMNELDEFRRSDPGISSRKKGRIHVVSSGESIQSAVDRAGEGALILIRPGLYSESVTITKSGITLLGLGNNGENGVVIQNPGGENSEEDGILVRPPEGAESIEGFSIYNVTVKDFEENGVFLVRTRNYFIAKVTTINNGEYGIFPVRSDHGVVFRSSAEGHTDAGIYIGQSENVAILHNKAYGNVLGFEVENSSNVITAHNTSYDNTIGILAVLLPPSRFITVLESHDVYITHNNVFNNNRDNFAGPGELASFIPKGIGLMVIGVDNAKVIQNSVRNNDLIGVGLGSTLLFGALSGLPPEAFEGIEPDADNGEVLLNRIMNNGTNPPDLPAPLMGIEGDLFWDGSGDNNCWSKNKFGTSFPGALPECTSSA